jgi:hypothetical protein
MEPRTFQEAIRSATVTYPIPLVFAVLLLFALLCAGGILLSTGWRSVFLAAALPPWQRSRWSYVQLHSSLNSCDRSNMY